MAALRNTLLVGLLGIAVFSHQAHAAAQDRALPPPSAPAPNAGPVTGPSERDIELANDPHRSWWDAYHPGETYQAATALAAHRLYCHDHPSEKTCAGWDWH